MTEERDERKREGAGKVLRKTKENINQKQKNELLWSSVQNVKERSVQFSKNESDVCC